jgi:hypothetical protein
MGAGMSVLLLRWIALLVGPVLLFAAYRLHRKPQEFWVLLGSGLVATLSLTASVLPARAQALMPVHVSAFALYAAGALLLARAVFTRLGPVARLLYLACGIAFLSPILILTSFAVALHSHGA